MRVKELVIVDRLPAYYLFDYAIMGNFALTTKDRRFILDEYAIEYEGQINTPGHHFSTVLKDIRFSRQESEVSQLSYPYKASIGKYPYAFYVDISHAFAQITNVFGLDCSFREGGYMGFGTTPLPEIFDDSKIMRALLVSGTGKESTLQEWKNGTIQSRRFPNRNYAPMLRGSIFSFLHSVAYILSRYTLYHHTDGFIVKSIYFDRVCAWLHSHRILYSVKGEGITEIYGVGSYRIGSTRTNNLYVRQRDSVYIRRDFSEWWLKQWDRGIARKG